MLCRWLIKVIRHGPVLPDGSSRSGISFLEHADHGPFFRAVEDCSCSLLRFFQVIHKGSLWLTVSEAKSAIDSVNLFCNAYSFLARRSYDQGECLFHLEPALHMYRHISVRMQAALDRASPAVLSPACFACDLSEDFVGKCARMSRRVAARTCAQRTEQRMLIRYFLEYEKLGL